MIKYLIMLVQRLNKSSIYVIYISTIFIFLSGCNSSQQPQQPSIDELSAKEPDLLYSYLMENLHYEITDLRVVEEEAGYHIVISVNGTADILQPLCVDTMSCAEKYTKSTGVQVSSINPIVYLGEEEFFGWSTSGTLYSDKAYPLVENVPVENISSELLKCMEPQHISEEKDSTSLSDMASLIEIALNGNYENYSVTTNDNLIIINLWQTNLAYAVLAIESGQADSTAWDNVKSGLVSMSESICMLMNNAGLRDAHLVINVLNDMNLDKILLSLYDGTVIIDVLS